MEQQVLTIYLQPALLLLIRVGTALRLTPFLGGRPLPMLPWIALSVGVSLVLLPTAAASARPGVGGVGSWLVLAAQEALIGAVLGLSARILFSVLQSAGGLVGAALPAVFSADAGDDGRQAPLVSLFVLFGTAAFLLMDGHHALIAALVGSFKSFPLAGGALAGDLFGVGFEGALGLFSGAFAWAVLVASPVFAAGLIAEFLTGLATRIVPALGQGTGSQALRTIAVQLALVAFFGASITAAVGFLREGVERIAAYGS